LDPKGDILILVGAVGLRGDARMSETPKRIASPASKPRRRSREPRWAAWSSDLSKIIATGDSIEQARDAVRALGEMEPALEPVQSRHRLA
jgi:hypothetical protein